MAKMLDVLDHAEEDDLDFVEQVRPESQDIFWLDSESDEDEVGGGKKGSFAESDYDPLKMYLKEMGNFPLLTRNQEIEAAQLIEKGKIKLMNSIFSMPYAIERLICFGDAVRNGEARLSDMIQNSIDSDEMLSYETKNFIGITEKIKILYRRPNVIGRTPAFKSSAEILQLLSGLKLKEGLIYSLFREMEDDVKKVDEFQAEMTAQCKRLQNGKCAVFSQQSGAAPVNTGLRKSRTSRPPFKKCLDCRNRITECEKNIGLAYTDMKTSGRLR